MNKHQTTSSPSLGNWMVSFATDGARLSSALGVLVWPIRMQDLCSWRPKQEGKKGIVAKHQSRYFPQFVSE